MNRFSLDEYTKEEVSKNGNEPYGGKRHDEILAYLKKWYDFDDYQLNDISMGIWLAIKNQREVDKVEIESLQSQIAELRGELEENKTYSSRLNKALNKLYIDISNGEQLDKDWVKETLEIEPHSQVLEALVSQNEKLKSKIKELKSELEKEKKVVDFYANANGIEKDFEVVDEFTYANGLLALQRQRERNESE